MSGGAESRDPAPFFINMFVTLNIFCICWFWLLLHRKFCVHNYCNSATMGITGSLSENFAVYFEDFCRFSCILAKIFVSLQG